MKTMTGKAGVWISAGSILTPSDLYDPKNITSLVYIRPESDWSDMGYTRVGEAEITVSIVDEKTLVENKVHSLREEAKNIRAEAHMKCVEIEGQIQNLLAISYGEATA